MYLRTEGDDPEGVPGDVRLDPKVNGVRTETSRRYRRVYGKSCSKGKVRINIWCPGTRLRKTVPEES